ncbi:YidC/Oxa1 family membrane protein insertase, partial [Bacillus sp. WP8]|uniref:YidC/Oxa1 family membrane protein insertase n=1 Tax=Bacillus sp. WP8 TaxID=756828 RepID=UPI0021B2E3EE
MTVLIRLVILRLMIKELRSRKGMEGLEGELKKVGEKYRCKDEKREEEVEEERMGVFEKNGVNGLGGCLGILIEMGMVIGLYDAIMRRAEIKKDRLLWFELGRGDGLLVLGIIGGVGSLIEEKLMMVGNRWDNGEMGMMLWVMRIT